VIPASKRSVRNLRQSAGVSSPHSSSSWRRFGKRKKNDTVAERTQADILLKLHHLHVEERVASKQNTSSYLGDREERERKAQCSFLDCPVSDTPHPDEVSQPVSRSRMQSKQSLSLHGQSQRLGIISLKLNNLDATNKETESDSRILYSGSTESTHPAERACLEMQKSTSQVLRSREEIEEDLRNKIEKSTLV
jgi:hypothetical protein